MVLWCVLEYEILCTVYVYASASNIIGHSFHCVEVDAESSIHPESIAPSIYNSSSDEDSQNASEEGTHEAADDHSSGDQSSEP